MWNYLAVSIFSIMKHDPYAGYFNHKKSVLLNLQIRMVYFINIWRKQEIALHSLWLDEYRNKSVDLDIDAIC